MDFAIFGSIFSGLTGVVLIWAVSSELFDKDDD